MAGGTCRTHYNLEQDALFLLPYPATCGGHIARPESASWESWKAGVLDGSLWRALSLLFSPSSTSWNNPGQPSLDHFWWLQLLHVFYVSCVFTGVFGLSRCGLCLLMFFYLLSFVVNGSQQTWLGWDYLRLSCWCTLFESMNRSLIYKINKFIDWINIFWFIINSIFLYF